MNDTVRMSVSYMTRHGDNKAIYVLFTDGDKSAEFTVPGCALLNNKGFDDEEIHQLKEYVENETKIFNKNTKTKKESKNHVRGVH